jgi:hypothetical protein
VQWSEIRVPFAISPSTSPSVFLLGWLANSSQLGPPILDFCSGAPITVGCYLWGKQWAL